MFGKKAKVEELIKLYAALSDEDKAKFDSMAKSQEPAKEPEEKTEDEKQIAEAEKDVAEKGEDTQTEEDRVDESVGEQEHLDHDEDTQTAEDRIDESEGAEENDESNKGEDVDNVAEENKDEIIQKLTERVSALEDGLKEFAELKAKMEEFTAKQADKFGYKGTPRLDGKDILEMSADELKSELAHPQ